QNTFQHLPLRTIGVRLKSAITEAVDGEGVFVNLVANFANTRNQRSHDRVKECGNDRIEARLLESRAPSQRNTTHAGSLCRWISRSRLQNRTMEFEASSPLMHHNIGKDIEKPYVRPMRLGWRELFKSKVSAEVHWDRWDFVALGLAVSAVIWVFLFILKTFLAPGYTSDLFVQVQLGRGWLEGRGLLQDNCFGNHLAIHTYFLLLLLGIIAKPFGAPGLLFVLAASVGAAYFWGTRILRLLGVDG